jgi:hypothetical protein
MIFSYTKKVTVNGKTVVEHHYWGMFLWVSKQSLQVDYEQTLEQGFEVRQFVNGRLHQATI